jgi:DNA polymerase elongation subunit (family B)
MSFYSYSWFVDESQTERTYIKMYGLDENNKTVCLHVTDFCPYAYVELPTSVDWSINNRVSLIKNKLDELLRDQKPISYNLQYKYKLYHAHYDENMNRIKFPYLLLIFNHKKDVRSLSYKLRFNIRIVGIGEIKLKIQETCASEILQMTTLRKIPLSGWISYKGKRIENESENGITSYQVKWTSLNPLKRDDIPKPLVASFDIEVNSSNVACFPTASLPFDKIFQISCVFHRNEGEYKKYLLSLGNPTTVDADVIARKFNTEADLLIGFTALIQEFQPNILIGYNIFSFDIPYMIARAELNDCLESFDRLGFNKETHSPKKKIKWSSSAYGTQEFEFLDIEGRLIVDLLSIVRRDYKFSNYKLNTVSKIILNDSKKDLDAQAIFKCYRLGMTDTEKGRKALGVCGNYCVQDTLLVSKLFDKLQTWMGLSEMASVCCVPIFHLFTQGQQIKVYSQIYMNCTHDNIVVEDTGYVSADNEHYSGAKVFPPIPGIYDKVIPFDFASLYPTSIIAYNIDYSTLVLDDKIPDEKCNVIEWEDHQGCEHDPKVIKRNELSEYIIRENALISAMRKEKKPNRERINDRVEKLRPYTRQRADLVKSVPKHQMCSHRKYRFLKEPIGVLPKLLKNLLDSRANTRKQMKKLDENELLYKVLNKRQLAFKVSANSAYGAMGVTKGYLPFMPGAMCTTAIGRKSIELVAETIPTKFKGTLVYGDSVSGDTPILIKYDDDTLDLKTIDDLSSNWIPYEQFKKDENDLFEKEQCLIDGKIWTGKWSNIKRVIRHKTTKKMYRILTHTGCIDVTEDHSLITPELKQIKPGSLQVGDGLLHSFPTHFDEFDITTIEGKIEYNSCKKCKESMNKSEFYVSKDGSLYTTCKKCCFEANHRNNPAKKYVSEYDYLHKPKTLTKEEAFVWGFFMAEGSGGRYKCGKYAWSLCNQDIKVLARCQSYLEVVEPCYRFVILDCMKSSKVYKLVPLGKVKMIAQKYGQVFFDKFKRKIVPYSILNGSVEIKEWFFEGYYAGDGYISEENSIIPVKGCARMDIKGKIGAQGLYLLLKSLGYVVSLNTREDKPDVFRLNAYKGNKMRKNPIEIKKIIPLPSSSSEYVYDIETDEGIFHAGIGELIVKNTDSNYISFPHLKEASASEIWKYSEYVAEEVSKLFKSPMNLAFEEVIYWRFLILSKKRYMSLSCKEDGVVSKEIQKKGVLLARRDNSEVIRSIYSNLIMKVFNNESLEDIIYYLVQEMNKVFSHFYENKLFVVSQSVGDIKIDDIDNVSPVRQEEDGKIVWKIGSYKVKPLPEDENEKMKKMEDKNALTESEYYLKSLPPQAQLALKLRKRGKPVETGERLEYIITTEANIKAKKSEKIESYEYFKDHTSVLSIDYFYYVKQLINPVDEVLNALYEGKLKRDFIASQYKMRVKREDLLESIRGLFTARIVS